MDVRCLLPCLVVAVVMCRSPGIGTAAPLTATNSIVNVVENKLKNLVDRGETTMGTVTCDVCKIIVSTVQKLYEAKTSWDEIAKVAGDICYWFRIEDERVCKSITEEFKVNYEDFSTYSFKNVDVYCVQDEVLSVFGMVGLSPSEVCGGYLGTSCGATYDPWNQAWSVVIPGNKPPVRPVPPPKVSFLKWHVWFCITECGCSGAHFVACIGHIA